MVAGCNLLIYKMPPAHTTFQALGSLPENPMTSNNSNSSIVKADQGQSSSTWISSKVSIPKLSSKTTELIERAKRFATNPAKSDNSNSSIAEVESDRGQTPLIWASSKMSIPKLSSSTTETMERAKRSATNQDEGSRSAIPNLINTTNNDSRLGNGVSEPERHNYDAWNWNSAMLSPSKRIKRVSCTFIDISVPSLRDSSSSGTAADAADTHMVSRSTSSSKTPLQPLPSPPKEQGGIATISSKSAESTRASAHGDDREPSQPKEPEGIATVSSGVAESANESAHGEGREPSSEDLMDTTSDAPATAPEAVPVPDPVAGTASASASATATPRTISPASRKQQKAPVSSGKRKVIRTNGAKGSNKRRRGDDSSDGESIIRATEGSSSDESDEAPLVTMTTSGRQVRRPSLYAPPPSGSATGKGRGDGLQTADEDPSPQTSTASQKRAHNMKNDGIIRCCRCERSQSATVNKIVRCHECNKPWHQQCHDPPISKSTVKKGKPWSCTVCKPPPKAKKIVLVRSSPHRSARMSSGISPTVTPNMELGGADFSLEERRGYLSRLSHAALVELLVGLSDLQPSLKMFPTNMKGLPSSRFTLDQEMSREQSQSPISSSDEDGRALEENMNGNDPQYVIQSTQNGRDYENPSDNGFDSEKYIEYKLYPRAGNFRLPADDLDILQEDDDGPPDGHIPTYSQSVTHG